MRALILLSALLLLSACQPQPSIQHLMRTQVDPAADALWAAVATEISREGEVQREPTSEAEWLLLRQHALTLIASADLLSTPGRPVAKAGAKLEDAHVDGISTPAQITAAISQDPAAFAAAADGLRQAGQQALAAIDARDVRRLFASGEVIDHACEQCHSRYWYPHAKQPVWPALPCQHDCNNGPASPSKTP